MSAALLLLTPSRTCQRLAHELRYYNLEAPQLDERLRPAEPAVPDYRLFLVGGEGPPDGPDHARCLQLYDHKVGGWGRLRDMGARRQQVCGAAAVATRMYAFGGEDDEALEPGCTSKYDMATGIMEEVAKLPRTLQSCTGVACDGLVYCLGGWDITGGGGVADVYAYIPDLDCWLSGPALPSAARSMAAAEHLGCIYACGGREFLDPVAALLMLDPRTRAWASLAAMPTGAADAGAAVVAGRMYVPGGTREDHPEHVALPSLQCYDMVAGRWDTGCAPMAEARWGLGVAAMHGEVWAVGGCPSGFGVETFTAVEVYSPWLNTWRAGVPLPHAWSWGQCVGVQCS